MDLIKPLNERCTLEPDTCIKKEYLEAYYDIFKLVAGWGLDGEIEDFPAEDEFCDKIIEVLINDIISNDPIIKIEKNKEKNLNFICKTFQNIVIKDPKLEWKILDNSIVEMTYPGVFKGLSVGETEVTASFCDVSETVKVKVELPCDEDPFQSKCNGRLETFPTQYVEFHANSPGGTFYFDWYLNFKIIYDLTEGIITRKSVKVWGKEYYNFYGWDVIDITGDFDDNYDKDFFLSTTGSSGIHMNGILLVATGPNNSVCNNSIIVDVVEDDICASGLSPGSTENERLITFPFQSKIRSAETETEINLIITLSIPPEFPNGKLYIDLSSKDMSKNITIDKHDADVLNSEELLPSFLELLKANLEDEVPILLKQPLWKILTS